MIPLSINNPKDNEDSFFCCLPVQFLCPLPSYCNISKIVTELEVFIRSSSPYNKLLNAPIKLDYNDQQILNEYFKI